MTYREQITSAMTDLGADPLVRFFGYGLTKGRAMGTLAGVKAEQLVETPVAENLMVGVACGASLAGLRPVIYVERADFLFCAADAIVNHLDKIADLSRGEFRPAAIIRVTIGNRTKPLFTGPTHTQNPARAFGLLLQMPVRVLIEGDDVRQVYQDAYEALCAGRSTMIYEHKDLL